MLTTSKRGLIVQLDLVSSTRELFRRTGDGKIPLAKGQDHLRTAVSALAEAFWEQGAQTLAFTGDGLLAFMQDTARPARMTHALLDALRNGAESLAGLCALWGRRMRLRGAVHYGEALQVLDGVFAGHLIGRSVLQMEEIIEAARVGDTSPDAFAGVVATRPASEYCQLPVRRPAVPPPRDSRLLSGCDELYLLDQPLLRPRPKQRDRQPPVAPSRRLGLVVYLGFRPSEAGPCFPRLWEYLACMESLAALVAACGAELISLQPTAVLGLVPNAFRIRDQLDRVWRAVFGDGPRDRDSQGKRLVRWARARGWQGVSLVGGITFGPVFQPRSGPLVAQSLGASLVLAARCAKIAYKQTADICIAVPRSRLASQEDTDQPGWLQHDPAGSDYIWTREPEVAPPRNAPGRVSPPVAPLVPDLYHAGYPRVWLYEASANGN